MFAIKEEESWKLSKSIFYVVVGVSKLGYILERSNIKMLGNFRRVWYVPKYARKQCRKKFVFANFLSELSTFQFNKVKTELMLNSITFRKEKTLETFLKTFLFSPRTRSWQFLHFFRKHETYPGVTWKLKLVLSFERSTTVLVSGILNRGMKELLFGFSEFEIISDWDNKILSTFLW